MASSINASTAGGGGIITTADSSGNLDIQSGGSTVVAVTSTGASVTGTLAATGAVSGTTGTFTSTLGVTGAITGSSTVAGSTGILYPLTSGTAVATTSGTSVDFTSIPSWVKRITVMFNGVSLSSTASILIQIGPSGGVETSSYSGVVLGNGVQNAWGGTGYLITRTGVATSIYSGIVTLANITGSTWICAGTVGDPTNGFAGLTAGTKAITGTLSIVRITSTSTDTFDAGSVNILYE